MNTLTKPIYANITVNCADGETYEVLDMIVYDVHRLTRTLIRAYGDVASVMIAYVVPEAETER